MLLVGTIRELEIELVWARLLELGAEVYHVDPYVDHLAATTRSQGVLLRCRRAVIAASTLTGCYLRFPLCGEVPPIQLDRSLRQRVEIAARRFASNYSSLQALLMHLDRASIVNSPPAGWSNASKPVQVSLLARFGFRVPRTIVTNSCEHLTRWASTVGRIICKGIGGHPLYAEEVDLERALGGVRRSSSPLLFQEFVQGTNVRVHVVGPATFAARILGGDRSDCRRGTDARARSFRLPGQIARACVEVTRACGLVFSGIDLIEASDGYVALEVNPMPGYGWYELETKAPISLAVARALLTRKPKSETDGTGPWREWLRP